MGSPKVDLAISLVKGLILTGQVRPGDRLPNEAELAGQLGVSRNSLREAVGALQAMRILEARQGDGTYVCQLDPSEMIEVLSFAVDVSDARSVHWFLDVRRTLEVQAVEIAAAHRTDAQLRHLQDIHAQIMSEDSIEALLALDTAFHAAIAEINGNKVQNALLRVVSAPTLRARLWRHRLSDTGFSKLRSEHALILEAIANRDVAEARHAVWQHISGVVRWVETHQAELNSIEFIDKSDS